MKSSLCVCRGIWRKTSSRKESNGEVKDRPVYFNRVNWWSQRSTGVLQSTGVRYRWSQRSTGVLQSIESWNNTFVPTSMNAKLRSIMPLVTSLKSRTISCRIEKTLKLKINTQEEYKTIYKLLPHRGKSPILTPSCLRHYTPASSAPCVAWAWG